MDSALDDSDVKLHKASGQLLDEIGTTLSQLLLPNNTATRPSPWIRQNRFTKLYRTVNQLPRPPLQPSVPPSNRSLLARLLPRMAPAARPTPRRLHQNPRRRLPALHHQPASAAARSRVGDAPAALHRHLPAAVPAGQGPGREGDCALPAD